MKNYGLIGFPLTHSFSVSYFAEKFAKEGITDAVYKNYPIESIEELPDLIRKENLSGFNITIPYKEAAIEYLDSIDPIAEAIDAVNCVKITDGKLTGYNTDVFGFRESLKNLIGDKKPKALVLGTGGSSKAVSHALTELNIPFTFVSRRKKAEWYTYNDLTESVLATHHLIINTTPLGMFPNTEESALIPYQYLTADHSLYDLIYNPTETQFLKKGREHNAQIKNGLEMLHIQAERNWEIWNS
ncbi:MAG: Shikimate dehydrogenase substrate binding domain protein [Bacteroidetes bacterium]|nr:Shikimate dehydrogenase substrate binding domain protein [Bacteroidota bacterium]